MTAVLLIGQSRLPRCRALAVLAAGYVFYLTKPLDVRQPLDIVDRTRVGTA